MANKHALTALALLAMTGGMGMDSGMRRRRDLAGEPFVPVDDTPKGPKFPFTDEEKEKLSKLGGKAKKQYLKELKEKYS